MRCASGVLPLMVGIASLTYSHCMSLLFVNAHRIFFYSAFSVLTVGVVVTNALKSHSNYYATAIHLSKSSRSVLVGLTDRPQCPRLICAKGIGQFWRSVKPPRWPYRAANIL